MFVYLFRFKASAINGISESPRYKSMNEAFRLCYVEIKHLLETSRVGRFSLFTLSKKLMCPIMTLSMLLSGCDAHALIIVEVMDRTVEI